MKLHPLLLGLALLSAAASPAPADELIVPQPADRDRPVTVHYRLDRPVTARGHLDVEWSDQIGRVVDRQRVPVEFNGRIDATFTLDLRRAVVMRNHLAARLSLAGRPAGAATTGFIARPADRRFDDYQIVMWQKQNATQWAALKRIGITAGTVFGDREGRGSAFTTPQIEPLLDHDLRWYVENIATDFYAAYHRWTPGKPVNWLFLETQRRYAANPLDPLVLRRQPSLADRKALGAIEARLATTVRAHERYAPLFYNLADEPGIADLSAHWDFDYSPAALAEFREHLKQRYGSLAALNAGWNTAFTDWDTVLPRTTRDAIEQPDENFAAWAEFKAWMDERFAATVRAGADAVRRVDANALTAITGGQVPGWGGWNYAALAGTVGAMETGNDGAAFDIARGLDPPLVLLTTLFARGGGYEEHRLWRQLLRGGRGAIIWDDDNAFAAPDGTLGPRGRDAASYFPALRGGLAALIMQSRRQTDAIGLLYSPASFRTRWLLDRQPDGDAWSTRSAEDEHNDDNDWRRSLVAHLRGLGHLGISPRVLSSRQVEAGALRQGGVRALILPHAIALSHREAAEIREFVSRGGIAIADIEPGAFDQLSRRLPRPSLTELFAEADGKPAQVGRGQAAILLAPAPRRAAETDPHLRRLLAQASLLSPFTLEQADGTPLRDVEIHRFQNGDVTLLAVHADLPRDAGADDLRSLDPRRVRLVLPRQAYLYDLREGQALGRAERADLALDPVKPVLLAIAETALPMPVLQAPARLRRGETATLSIVPGGNTPAALHVYRVEVLDPVGATLPHYSANLIAPAGRGTIPLPVALNDPTGRWQIRVTDRLSGISISAAIEVAGP